MDHKTWLNSLIGTDSHRAAAGRIGTNGSTISRQLSRGGLSPEMVIALCREYGRPPATGLVETGYLSAREASQPDVALALKNATNKQLLDEINRRSDPEALRLFTASEDPNVVDVDEAEVFDFPDNGVSPTTYNPEKHVAYNGPDEDQLRREQTESDEFP